MFIEVKIFMILKKKKKKKKKKKISENLKNLKFDIFSHNRRGIFDLHSAYI